jgi:hypothetical protein
MSDALANQSNKHNEAVKAVVTKLMPPADLVGSARNDRRAELVHKFWVEHRDFTLKLNKFADPDLWIIAANPMVAANKWWSTYGLTRSEVLGCVACVVTSKTLGIGSAERHWKIIKAAKREQQARNTTEKCKKSALVYGAAMQQRARHREKKLLTAGKLWTDDDFLSLKLDTHCKEVIEKANSISKQQARIFRAWEEEWEKVAVGANGDDVLVLETRMVRVWWYQVARS